MERLSIGQRVYYPHNQRGWCLGKLLSVNTLEKKAEVEDEETRSVERLTQQSLPLIHGFMENAFDARDPELFRVSDLHVATLLHCVKERCEKMKLQYSRMGDMILSINPFQPMGFNSDEERGKYLSAADPMQLAPHVWQISHKAFTQIIVRDQGNQSVVISGESGSGKTENTKMLINYLGQLSFKHSCNAAQRQVATQVSDRLKWSNPILESFGNARTVRNDNSSRFGKYTKLFFDSKSGVMVGGEMVTYLLEKSRIIYIAPGERNYHVFYEMLAGLTPQEKAKLGGLKDAGHYKCLNRGDTLTRRGVDGRTVDDSKEFQVLTKAFGEMGLGEEQRWGIFKTLAAVLHMQDITFGNDDNDKACFQDASPLKTACDLLGVSFEALKPCFLIKSTTKIMTLQATKSEAEGLRDAFCKALYVGLFDRLVAVVNESIRPAGGGSGYKYIGVLDIFGFENFQKNSFEQMCINFANETLQNHYNKYTFLNDTEECQQEGVQCPDVQFPNNAACLEMFGLSKTGIFALLDEECGVKTGTSQNYTTNVWNIWGGKNDYFIRPKTTIPTEFGIRHYANFVSYNTEEWLEKNVDSLKEEAKKAVQASSDRFISQLLETIEAVPSDGTRRGRVTVASRFQSQLLSLRGELESTETHFIRCVKPNMSAQPAVMDNLYVGGQLESAGVLQTIALKRQGYPVRRLLQSFSAFFYLIAPRRAVRLHQQRVYGEAVKIILEHYKQFYKSWQPTPNYAVGRTKVFMRGHIWSTLERLVIRRKRYLLKRVIPYLENWARRFRKKKAEAEKRRLEQQRQLQQQAQQREQQATQKGGIDYRATALKSGLNEVQANIFADLVQIFRNFDLPIIMDVVFNLPKKEQAQAALEDMQNDRLNEALPEMLRRVFQDLKIRSEVVEALAAKGVVSIASLAQLSPQQLQALGMSSEEISRLTAYMLSQQSERVVQERLQEQIGTGGSLEQLFGSGRGAVGVPDTAARRGSTATRAAPPAQANNGPSGVPSSRPAAPSSVPGAPSIDEGSVNQLTRMGFSRDAVVAALTRFKGDVTNAGQYLMSVGSSSATSGAPSSPSGVARNQQANSTTPPPAQSAVAPPPRIVPPPNRPTPPGSSGVPVMGVVVSDPASPQRTTSAGVPPQAVDARKLDQLVSMGFDRVTATNALNASKGDVQGAINRLLR
ncbi:myosin heavy chain, putative [Bodo saltans]|uniref:Myosin heavy chain, putative n=1 Tax=Bodo saltans TaxID=75058 RepID=A0A0S4IVZ8_BODSA|nr:myosin heavy chain, putative [Bodo saltans]|eukprot:CUG03103.1 myosin heavy chain, putative [Bodo saltans]